MVTESAPVITSRLASDAEQTVARITLNLPATLNSLTLEMIDLIAEALESWRQDDSIAAVFIDGHGEKAFCAGGDVQQLYQSAVETPGGPCEYAETFFAREYRMNHTLHSYEKPLICWGQGIVMGGGMGVFAGCSHKVVTESTRFAMPEVTIALFPDVGGSYFLNRFPAGVGRFLALTAASFNGNDALDFDFATALLPSDSREQFYASLGTVDWQSADALDRHIAAFAHAHEVAAPPAQVLAHRALIENLSPASSKDIYRQICALETEDKWLGKARDGLAHGSPLAALWIDEQLRRAKTMELADVFRSELVLATNIVRHPEFAEGVRALLIDKDRQPAWQFKSVNDIDAGLVVQFFDAPWAENPLADL